MKYEWGRDMKYVAHINEQGEQTLKKHLEGTAELAKEFAEKFGKGDWGYCSGMLHDIGKYSLEFQKRIKENGNQRVDHSTAGAQVCMDKGGLYGFLGYCIAGHHAGLPDTGVPDHSGDSTLMGRKKKKIPDYHAYKQEIEIPKIVTEPFDPKKVKSRDFSLSVFIRMLYSCLVDADYLDTEAFMSHGNIVRDSGESPEILLKKLDDYVSDWLKNKDLDTIYGRRTEILRHCLEAGEKEKGLFRLTVPTGGGKTIASLGFALRHAVKHQMDRIIYVIPYTSIIEQNAAVFREILGDRNVLENHCNVNYDDSEEWIPMKLATENWDKPVVVTTNVQFFESLFGNRSSSCRKLHNIANSVVIFDEAQMLPCDYLKPCTAMIEELICNYGISAVLCTATQPSLDSFFQGMTITELCPRMEEQFTFFKRTEFVPIGSISEKELADRLNKEEQALCIINTRKRAQSLYEKLEGAGTYHLSTCMYPEHRKRILEEIRARLKTGKRCIVVSTSLVEAGVDLDFRTVYRQLAGVDSMIQAAGRCNREGKHSSEESKAVIFQFEGREFIPGQKQQMDAAKNLILDGEDISDLKNISRYFETLYSWRREGLDKKKIMEEFKSGYYNFATVGKEFKLIEQNTVTILIPKEEKAIQILHQLKNKGYTKTEMRKAGQYCIQVYEQEFKKMYDAGMIYRISEDIQDFYELKEVDRYTEELGLKLDLEEGIALFF